ncbi:Hpt domain-containing protein [Oharaeibacter diazotrophicus]|uniref:Hpt domain-containing protein n=1 Tax=Oharaeibacter diazotrophicus TaxID=1920512 RepID=A0A4R6RLX1_9HYPH|nr:Hpt domain-containing protein [Oharaeibacter diazotrophicus]TDP87669.1 Hpt domain-containing protein [Oharaeibacter diazotrophicus]BBE74747.1 hypothetical protein OHA_1_04384 [Pleomorphomonas sp. SM30]GLS77130.1 hypothetical protein GCM10007904_24670 [Oharaeibacter diazotrophicus]
MPGLAVGEAEPIDFAHLDRQTFGDAGLAREVLGLFLTQSAALVAAIEDPGADRAGAAHKLLGSARGIGAPAVAAAAAEAERAFLDGSVEAERAVGAVRRAVETAAAAIREHLRGGASA